MTTWRFSCAKNCWILAQCDWRRQPTYFNSSLLPDNVTLIICLKPHLHFAIRVSTSCNTHYYNTVLTLIVSQFHSVTAGCSTVAIISHVLFIFNS